MDATLSYIAYGAPGEYHETWSLLFRTMDFLDHCWHKKIFFSLVGHVESSDAWDDVRHMALIVTNDSTYRFSRGSWGLFLSTLQPHTYQPQGFIIQFANGAIELNIYTFLYAGIYVVGNPDDLVSRYYKSGTIPICSTAMNTYREVVPETTDYLDPGPIEVWGDGAGYAMEFVIAGRRRRLLLVPSIKDTWP